MQKTSIYIILTFCLLLAIALVVKASPTNYLTNPSFTGGITGWTVGYDLQDAGATIGYDSTYYQDTAGSLKGDTAAGKKQDVQGYAKQTVGTAINVEDTVKLQLRWSKRNIVAAAVTHTIKAQICKPGLDCAVAANWTDIWSDISIPAADGATAWADTGLVDVDSYFDVSGTYQFRWYFLMQSANSTGAQTLAWIDNTSLDVSPPVITVGATGSQTANMNVNSTNNYVGGAFTFVRNTGSADVTQIIITDTGTVNANLNLSNVDIYYETAASCVYDATETLFGTAASFNVSEKATITGTMSVGTSQVCVYVVLDVGSGASAGQTIEIEISNPSTEVTVSAGTVSPATAVAIAGTTTLQAAPSLTFSISDLTIGFGSWTGTELRYATGDTNGSTTEPGATLPTQLTASTNAPNGLTITVRSTGDGTNAGLYKSVSPTKLILAVASSAVAAGSEGYGVYGKNASLLTIDAGFNNDGISDLAITTSAQTFASTTGPVSSGTVDLATKAAISILTPAGSYSDALTLICTGNF